MSAAADLAELSAAKAAAESAPLAAAAELLSAALAELSELPLLTALTELAELPLLTALAELAELTLLAALTELAELAELTLLPLDALLTDLALAADHAAEVGRVDILKHRGRQARIQRAILRRRGCDDRWNRTTQQESLRGRTLTSDGGDKQGHHAHQDETVQVHEVLW